MHNHVPRHRIGQQQLSSSISRLACGCVRDEEAKESVKNGQAVKNTRVSDAKTRMIMNIQLPIKTRRPSGTELRRD